MSTPNSSSAVASAAAAQPQKSIFAPGLFKDVVFLITGGGTGIGKAVAVEAVQLGAKVALCGRRQPPLSEAAAELAKISSPDRVYFETCDIREPEKVDAFVRNVLKKFGRIDCLINNAGGQFLTTAEGVTPKGFQAVIRNNLIGTWNMTHAVATLAMIPQHRGSIVNVIAQIKRGFPGMVHTGAARAGVDNLTKTISIEWSKHNIRANSVAPGVIKTEGTQRYPTAFLDRAAAVTPVHRLGTSQEIAHLILFLSSAEAAGFITGQTYYADGGQSLYGDLMAELSAKL